MPGVSYSVRINVNRSQVVDHFLSGGEACLRVLVVPGLQVLLGVTGRTVK